MFTSLVFGVALIAPTAPIPKDTTPPPTGPAPWIVYLKTGPSGQITVNAYTTRTVKVQRAVAVVENGQTVVKQVEQEVTQTVGSVVNVNELVGAYSTVRGMPATGGDVLRRAERGVAVLVSADGKPIDKGWLLAAGPDALVLTSAALAGTIAPRPHVPATTTAPRLVLLRPDADGSIPVETRTSAARTALRVNAVGGVPQLVEPPQAPGTARPTTKRLEDLKFDAYDLSGKRVDREVALARLKAGGLVLVAGENQAPDPAYLGLFRGDLLVLAFTELTNSPTTAVAPGIAVRPVAVVRVAPLAPPVPAPALPAVKPAPAVAPVAPKAVPAPALPAKEG